MSSVFLDKKQEKHNKMQYNLIKTLIFYNFTILKLRGVLPIKYYIKVYYVL